MTWRTEFYYHEIIESWGKVDKLASINNNIFDKYKFVYIKIIINDRVI